LFECAQFTGLWKTVWCVTGKTVHLKPLQEATAFKDEDTRGKIFWAKNEISKDVHAKINFRMALDLEVDACAATGTSPRSDFSLFQLNKKASCFRTAVYKHMARKFLLDISQRAIWDGTIHGAEPKPYYTRDESRNFDQHANTVNRQRFRIKLTDSFGITLDSP
jgi:hypothetical protein